jgi:phytoene desaturase
MAKKVIVVGGGVGGLSGAIRLAKMGYEVHLYEKNKQLGGKMGRITCNGCTFDTGPTLLTMPFVAEELFQFAGHSISDYIQVIPIEPVCRYFFNDVEPFDASSNLEIMQNNLNRLFPEDTNNYIRFLKYTERIYKKTFPVFISSPIHEIRKMLTWRNLYLLFSFYQIDPFRTVHQSVAAFFKNTHLVQLFSRFATYNGSDPYRAPATLNVIPYVELGLGGFYIKNGLYQLVESLVKLAQEGGVYFYTEKKVDRILHDNQRVKGVMIEGEKIDGDIILCNSDVVVSYTDLITDFPVIKNKLNQLEPSLSGLIFFWGIKKQFPQLKQHNIIFSQNYEREFKRIFQDLMPPQDPTIYISISSKYDQMHAPPGGENWFVLINMPYLKQDQKREDGKTDQIRQVIMQKLKQVGIHIEGEITKEMIIEPLDIANRYNSNRGSIYGISSNTMQSAFKRPPNRSRQLGGLYFCGGSTHPGGGVPMCMLSGKIAAELINEFEDT